jgi:hypothetical protein
MNVGIQFKILCGCRHRRGDVSLGPRLACHNLTSNGRRQSTQKNGSFFRKNDLGGSTISTGNLQDVFVASRLYRQFAEFACHGVLTDGDAVTDMTLPFAGEIHALAALLRAPSGADMPQAWCGQCRFRHSAGDWSISNLRRAERPSVLKKRGQILPRAASRVTTRLAPFRFSGWLPKPVRRRDGRSAVFAASISPEPATMAAENV